LIVKEDGFKMAVYDYECINKQGELIRGQINGENISSSLERLKSMGFSVVDLKERKTQVKSSLFISKKKVTLGELSLFSRQLSSMISAGIPITRALFTLSSQADNPSMREALENIAANVEGGMNLTDAFGAYPEIFSGLYVSMIHSGELGGIMETTLERLSEQLQKEKQLRDNIKSATFYPRMLLGFALIVFIAMLLFLVPVFEKFIPAGNDVPGITRFIFSLSASVKEKWYIWILILSAITAAVLIFIKSDFGKRVWERLKFKMPVFGSLIQKTVVARFSRTLSTLLEGGIPVVQAMQSAGPTSGSMLVADAVLEATRRIEEGKSIAAPLEESGVFPPMVTHMISVGEKTGGLPSLLDKIAQFYEDEVAILTKGLSSIIEPLMLIIIGILVGGMLISLYLPIFSSVASTGY
jgi:type IV pilus assembly protein PilC